MLAVESSDREAVEVLRAMEGAIGEVVAHCVGETRGNVQASILKKGKRNAPFYIGAGGGAYAVHSVWYCLTGLSGQAAARRMAQAHMFMRTHIMVAPLNHSRRLLLVVFSKTLQLHNHAYR